MFGLYTQIVEPIRSFAAPASAESCTVPASLPRPLEPKVSRAKHRTQVVVLCCGAGPGSSSCGGGGLQHCSAVGGPPWSGGQPSGPGVTACLCRAGQNLCRQSSAYMPARATCRWGTVLLCMQPLECVLFAAKPHPCRPMKAPSF